MNSFYIQSHKGNCYHFNANLGIISLIDPVVFYISTRYHKERDEFDSGKRDAILHIMDDFHISLEKAESYFLQYLSLEKQCNLDECKSTFDNLLTPDMIEKALSNLKQLTFEVTDACNLSCRYCAYGELYQNYDVREHKKMPLEYARQLIKYLKNYWESSNCLAEGETFYVSFYGGEPLLNMPFIKEIVRIFETSNLRRRIQYSMTTNGINLKTHIDYLVNKDFHLLVSLDGNGIHNNYRVFPDGTPSYPIVYDAIKRIQTQYPSFFRTNVDFNAVIHNKNSVGQVLKFFQREFGKVPSLGELNPVGVRKDCIDRFNVLFRNVSEDINKSSDKRWIESRLKDHSPLYHALIVFFQQYSPFVFKKYNNMFTSEGKRKFLPTGTCTPFSRKLFVTVNGKLFPCERIGQEHALGRIDLEGVHLNSEEICEFYNRCYSRLSRQCAHCYLRFVCQQCIFNLPDMDTPYCLNYTTAAQFQHYLQDLIEYMEDNPKSYGVIMKQVMMR